MREIKELLDIKERGVCPCGQAEALVRQRIADIDADMARLGGLRAELVRLIEGGRELEGCIGDIFQIEGVKK